MKWTRSTGLILLVFVALAVTMTTPAAAGGVVGSGTPASCTQSALKDAVKGGGTVTFNCGPNPHTITLTSQVNINNPTTIDGGGLITLSGGNSTRVLYNAMFNALTVKNLTIRDAYHVGDTGGGGIQNDYRANLTVHNVTFINNTTKLVPPNVDNGGGAIRVHGGVLKITSSTFSNNHVIDGSGGAIHAMLSNSEVTDTTFKNNTNTGKGYSGAWYNDGTYHEGTNGYVIHRRNSYTGNSGNGQGGAMFMFLYPEQSGSYGIVEDSLFKNNTVTLDYAGHAYGAALRPGNGPVTLKNLLFVNNQAIGGAASAQGGALWLGEVLSGSLTNITITGNSAGLGGGIFFNNSGSTKVNNLTIAGNSASSFGGGVYGGGSNIAVRNTIIASNTAGNPWNQHLNCNTALGSGGNNLQFPRRNTSDGNDRDCFTSGVTFAAPKLAALDHSSNHTGVMVPLAGSPAINKGNDSTCAGKDQRGVSRPQGDHCDIGAAEVGGSGPQGFSLVYPSEGVTLTGTEVRPAYRWTASNGATDYRLIVRTAAGVIVYKAKFSAGELGCAAACTVNPAALPAALKDGKSYKWKVIAMNDFGRARTKNSTFQTDYPGPVSLNAPNNTTLKNRTPTLTWTKNSAVTQYKVVIFNTSRTFIKRYGWYNRGAVCSGDICTLNLSSLPDGGSKSLKPDTYKWKVLARSEYGKSKSMNARFTID